MGIKSYDFEGKLFRAKVPIPFMEAAYYMPKRVYVDGCFMPGTVFKFDKPVCSKKMNMQGEEVNDYCHAAALIYSERFNGHPEAEEDEDKDIVFHVDLSSFFLLLEPVEDDIKI